MKSACPAGFHLLLLALVLAAPGRVVADPGSVETSRPNARVLPLPKGDDVFHFVIYGDRTGAAPGGIAVLKQAVRETNLLDPDLVMTVGDLVQGYNATAEWLPEMREFRSIMDGLRMPWYPVAGNHDIYWRGPDRPAGQHEQNYERHFGPLWYWFRHKNAAFIVLYSDEGDAKGRKGWRKPEQNRMSTTQIAWLKSTLEKTRDAEHVFVFLHHPRWIQDRYVGANWDAVHAVLKTPGNVRAVFAGHIHRQRSDGPRDGIEYLTLAVVGGRLPFSAPGTGWLNQFNVVTVRKGRVSYASLPVGAVYDPKELTEEHREELGLLMAMQPEHGAPIDVTPKLTPVGEYRLVFSNPTKRPIEVTLDTSEFDRAWWLTPAHEHATIAPGEKGEFRFRYARIPRGEMRPPEFTVDVAYLAKTQRVELPTRHLPAHIRVRGLDAAWWSGAPDQALRIEDDRSALRVPSGALVLPDGPFTVEARVKLTEIPKRAGVVSKAERSGFGLFLYDGKPSFEVHLDGKYARAKAKQPIAPGHWHSLAGVFDGKEVRIYLDGELVAKRAGSGKRTRNSLPLYVGADPNRRGAASSGLPGWIDEVRISNVARYEGKSYSPAPRFVPDESTLLLLHLNRAVGPLYPDHSSRRGHAVSSGKVGLQPVK